MDFQAKFQAKLSKLNEHKSYTLIDMNLTKDEKETLKNFNISIQKGTKIYTIDPNYENKITNILSLNANNDAIQINNLYNLINRIIKNVIDGYNTEAAGVDIRFALPSDEYIIPRWHYDGRFFRESSEMDTKFVMTLIGEGTILCECDKNTRKEFLKVFHKIPSAERIKIENRKIFNNLLLNAKENEHAKIVQVKEDSECGCIFIVGNPEIEVIHSEPNITKPRLYIAIVANTNDNIAKWKYRQDEYSRLVKLGDKDKLEEFLHK